MPCRRPSWWVGFPSLRPPSSKSNVFPPSTIQYNGPLPQSSNFSILFLHPPILQPSSIHLAGALVEAEQDDRLHSPLHRQVLPQTNSRPVQSNSQIRSFSFVEKTSEEANWARNWSSAFYLDVKTSSYIHQTEFYACKQILNCIPRANLFTYFHKKIQLKNLFNRFYVSQERIQINIKSQDHKPHFCDRWRWRIG